MMPLADFSSKKFDQPGADWRKRVSTDGFSDTEAPSVILLLQCVRQGGLINPRGALFLITTGCFFALGQTAFGQATFKIDTLTANNVSATDAAGEICDDRGGIAVSTSKVFLEGDGGPQNSCAGSAGNAGIWNRS